MTFRLRHDCPVAGLSAALPEMGIRAWSGHRREILHVRTDRIGADAAAEAILRRVPNANVFPFAQGLVVVYEPDWPKQDSISRRLEEHGALWLQPLQYQAGWEYYDVISLDDDRLQEYLQSLLTRYSLEVVSRRAMDQTDLAAAFFVPINPVLENLSPKQEEALLAAWRDGYYRQPRGCTTRDVAQGLGISRSAFEERLRKAENLLVDGIAPNLSASGARKRQRRR